MPLKPEAVPSSLVCSVCGLPWPAHKRKTVEECVRLLKAEVAKRRVYANTSGTTVSYPAQFFHGQAGG